MAKIEIGKTVFFPKKESERKVGDSVKGTVVEFTERETEYRGKKSIQQALVLDNGDEAVIVNINKAYKRALEKAHVIGKILTVVYEGKENGFNNLSFDVEE
jgi:hypothetical protein